MITSDMPMEEVIENHPWLVPIENVPAHSFVCQSGHRRISPSHEGV